MDTYQLTSSMRFRAMLYFLGWQGGTIAQVAHAIDLKENQILNEPLASATRLMSGFSAIRTCDRAWRVNTLLPKSKGDWSFFSDAIRGFWATGPLDKLDDRWPDHPVKTGLMQLVEPVLSPEAEARASAAFVELRKALD